MNAHWSPAGELKIRGAVAVWVLFAHLWALLLPLALVTVVALNIEFVATSSDYAWLFYVTAGVMMAGSAFEIAQNTIDRWYLTPGCGSADGKSFCDMMFFWMIVLSQALVIIACFGARWWLTVPVLLIAVVYPWFYSRARLTIVPLALLGTASVAAAWFTFRDPLIFLQLLVSPLTGAVFGALLRTGAQVLHGVTTLVASSNVLILTLAIAGAADGEPTVWWVAGGIGLLAAAAIPLIPQATKNLAATPQPG